jgi:hypothetical protein
VERDPAACFDRARAALDGASVPLTSAGSKMLRFMLEDPSGCDAWLTRQRFVATYGWHPSHHRYFSEVAVEVVGFLCERLGARSGVIAGSEIVVDGFIPWSHGARAVWIDVASDKITISIREATSTRFPPRPLEQLIEYVDGRSPCPSCGDVPERYRRLRDGALVCLGCGASHRER